MEQLHAAWMQLKENFPDAEYSQQIELFGEEIRQWMAVSGTDRVKAMHEIANRFPSSPMKRQWLMAAAYEMTCRQVGQGQQWSASLMKGDTSMAVETDEFDLGDVDLLDDVDVDLDVPIGECPTTITAQFEQPTFPPAGISARGEMTFDLETIPDESRRPLFGLDEPVIVKSFTNPPVTGEAWVEWMKRPIAQIKEEIDGYNPDDTWLEALHAWERKEKKPRQGVLDIVKNIRAARNPSDDAEAVKLKTMGVTPEFCRIVAMGIGWSGRIVGTDEPVDVINGFVVGGAITEIELLDWFWDSVKNVSTVVGYNVLHFDLPVIFARSAILGVTPSRKFDMRPWGTDVLDLMKVRWPAGGQMKLKDIARIMGLDIPAGDVDGSQVAELFRTDPKLLAAYVKSDVYITQQLRRKWRGFWC